MKKFLMTIFGLFVLTFVMIAQAPPNPPPRGQGGCPTFAVGQVPFSSAYSVLTDVDYQLELPMNGDWTDAVINVSAPSYIIQQVIPYDAPTTAYQVNAVDFPHLWGSWHLKTTSQYSYVTYTVILSKSGCSTDTKTATIYVHR